jgi:hypothetical protein
VFTYQVRPRTYRHPKGTEISFPNNVELVFHFRPLQPFGKESGCGRTAVKSVAAKARFDANTGRHWIKSKKPLMPLEVIIKEPIRLIKMFGNELHIQTRFNSLKEMDEVVQSLFFAFPILLNVEFVDSPFIERVHGTVGKVAFRWELVYWRMEFDITTQEHQEKRIVQSWERLEVLSNPDNRRIVAALHYFHVACRLCRVGNSPWEFMSEVILNLSKVLEVLFPPTTKDSKTIDAARTGLSELGYSTIEIEHNFIPAMAIRNQIDSAHVSLSIFTREQLRVLHAYTEVTENAFREMLKRLVTETQVGHYIPVKYSESSRQRAVEKIIDQIAQHSVSLDDMSKKISTNQ